MLPFQISTGASRLVVSILLATGLCACGGGGGAPTNSQVSPAPSTATPQPQQVPTSTSALQTPAPNSSAAGTTKYFGYALVDCGFDDPLDLEVKNNYVTEVAAFSNIAQMCAYDPADNLVSRLKLMSDNGIQAILSVQGIFFEGKPDATQGSGMKFTLYPNYLDRWNNFVHNNNLTQQVAHIAAFYIADEPNWNGISNAELQIAADAVKSTFPTLPIAMSEAATNISTLVVPNSVDWIGLVHYAIPSPDTNSTFKNELSLLKSKRTNSSQKIFLAMDAQWLPFYGAEGFSESYMASVATSYYNLASSDPDVIAIIGYTWAGGFDSPQQKGVRELPSNVLAEHMRIGKLITGK